MILPSGLLGQNAPSKRVTMGFIGMGNRGTGVMEAFLNHADVQGVAVCDVDDFHFRVQGDKRSRDYGRTPGKQAMEAVYAKRSESGSWKGCTPYADFRELIARDDIDAVMVATPDHWHAIITMTALQNGKDVYCEKPMTHLYAEGHTIHREVAKRKAVFQVGSQQRSDALFQQGVEIVRNGLIGKVHKVEVGLPTGHDQPEGDTTVKTPPADLDYDFWCGPSQMLPYMEARHHWSWRWTLTYGGGQLMDWIGHHNDITHWALGMDQSGPSKIEAVGWTFPATSVYNTPHQYEILCEYETGVTTSIASRHAIGSRIIGDEGWLYVQRGKLEASDSRLAKLDFDCGPKRVYHSDNHTRNFLDCIRTRRACIAPAETAHRSITPGHLGYVSHTLGRSLQWDAAIERVIGDDEANQLLTSVDYRAPWRI